MKFQKPILFLNNRSKKNSIEIITALAILGIGTTRDLVTFILNKNKKIKRIKIQPSEIRTHTSSVIKRLNDRQIGIKTHPGLLSQGFIIKTAKSIEKHNPEMYSLSFKGSILALGFNFTDIDIKRFINNSARISLFFSYLDDMINNTSLKFTKTIVIDPIRKLIQKGFIPLDDDDFNVSFSTISDYCGREYFKMIEKQLIKNLHQIEVLHDISEFLEPDWYQESVEYYYNDEHNKQFFFNNSDDDDMKLFYKLRRSITNAYNEHFEMDI